MVMSDFEERNYYLIIIHKTKKALTARVKRLEVDVDGNGQRRVADLV